jgi:DNA-binding beta-propeller fold protein YncE
VGNFNGAATTIRTLAYDPSGGVFYGSDYNSLFIINPGTAATSFVGGFGGPGNFWALTFVPGLGLYGFSVDTGTLYQINTATGALTAVGPAGADRIAGLAYDPTTGRLIGASDEAGGGNVYEVSLTTGHATLLNVSGHNFTGLAVPQPAPEPGTLSLFGLGLLGLLGFGRRRRKRAA